MLARSLNGKKIASKIFMWLLNRKKTNVDATVKLKENVQKVISLYTGSIKSFFDAIAEIFLNFIIFF